MNDPLEELLLRQPLDEPPASLDRRVRRRFLERQRVAGMEAMALAGGRGRRPGGGTPGSPVLALAHP